jgi:hypothetical protein
LSKPDKNLKRWWTNCPDEQLGSYLQKITDEAMRGSLPLSWYEASVDVLKAEVIKRVSEKARKGGFDGK